MKNILAKGSKAHPENVQTDLLQQAFDLIVNRRILEDLTADDKVEYEKLLESLKADIEFYRQMAQQSEDPDFLIALAAGLIFHAHGVGTYKVPSRPSPIRTLDFLSPRTKKPTAAYVAVLEAKDPEFRQQRIDLNTRKMRAAKAAPRVEQETALVANIIELRGGGPSAHPNAEASRILTSVNQKLLEAGFPEVKIDVVRRRLERLGGVNARPREKQRKDPKRSGKKTSELRVASKPTKNSAKS